MRSTFAGFTTAQLGLSASQQALNVTGQNISNINTTGYTRQALDQISLNFTSAGRYATSPSAGYGVLVKNITQIRDPFLDVRFRNEVAKVGEADVRLSVLTELESILDEVDTDGIQAQLSDLSSMLQDFSANVGSSEFENTVKSSAESLTKLFNQYAKQIEAVKSDLEYSLKEVDIPQINDIIENIAELNKTIKTGQINENNALELIDQRNTLIDELASYVKINVQYVPVEISSSLTVEELKIDFVGENSTINLINGSEYATFEIPDGTTTLNIVDQNSMPVTDILGNTIGEDIFDELTTGSIKSSLETLICSGEFDDTENSARGISYYEKMLDLMASTLANVFNDINNSGLDAATPEEDLHNLFASSDGGEITAKTICIADGWSKCDYGLTASTAEGSEESGANENILKMIDALNADQSFIYPGSDIADPADDKTMFTGSFNEFFSKLSSTLGIDISSTSQTLDNHVSIANEISDSKESISGVSLDEEGMNLLKYQKSYAAAARLMTALDEALDTLINKMGVVGR